MDNPALSLETTDRLPEHWRVATELERRIRESSHPEAVFLWCDLTFKVKERTRRKRVRQPARVPLVRNRRTVNPGDPLMKTWRISSVDDSNVLSVSPKGRNHTLNWKLAAQYAVRGTRGDYVKESGPIASVVRVISDVNQHFFKGRSRRSIDPERLTCAVGFHDRDRHGNRCRPHIHLVIGIPPEITEREFRTAWKRATKRQRFIYRRTPVEPLREDLRRALAYMLNPEKASVGNPLIYLHIPRTEDRTHEPNQKTRHAAPHAQRPS